MHKSFHAKTYIFSKLCISVYIKRIVSFFITLETFLHQFLVYTSYPFFLCLSFVHSFICCLYNPFYCFNNIKYQIFYTKPWSLHHHLSSCKKKIHVLKYIHFLGLNTRSFVLFNDNIPICFFPL